MRKRMYLVESAFSLLTNNAKLFLQQLVQHWPQHNSVLRRSTLLEDVLVVPAHLSTRAHACRLLQFDGAKLLCVPDHRSLWFA